MSHFTVMVIGDDHEKLLAPFHEFECTGLDNEYIQNIDETESLLEQYQTEKTDMILLAEGTYKEPYNDEFWPMALTHENDQAMAIHQAPDRGPMLLEDGRKFRVNRIGFGRDEKYEVRVRNLPEGAKEVNVTYSEYMTFAEYIKYCTGRAEVSLEDFEGTDLSNLKEEYKYGLTVINGEGEVVKTINRTNPNAKWDWYSVGGRWRGMLMLNGEYREAISHYEALTKRGKPIPDSLLAKVSLVMAGESSWMNKGEEVPKHMVDSAPFEAIDWDGMMKEAGEEAGKTWDEAFEIHQGKLWASWSELREMNSAVVQDGTLPALSMDGLRDKYHGQENLKAFVTELREKKKGNISPFFNLDKFLMSREDYVNEARDQAISTFAVIKDGQWIERGQMGWFGFASNEKDQKKWSDEFRGLLENIEPMTQITIVDCHI